MTTLPALIQSTALAKISSRRRLDGLEKMAFQHPADLAMLSRLERVPLLPSVVAQFVDTMKEPIEIELIGNSFHVTQESLPEVYSLYLQACDSLCVDSPPPLYVVQNPIYNGYTTGVDKPFVVLHSGLVSAFDDDELVYIMGHELGHVISGHVQYHTLVRILSLAGVAALPGLAKLAVDVTLTPLLYRWSRRSEYTCDRAGLLACQSLDAARRAHMKMAGFPVKYFDKICSQSILEQAKAFRERTAGSWLSQTFALTQKFTATHPRAIERAVELQQWVDGGWYDEIVNGTPDSRTKLAKLLSGDPLMAELRLILSQSLIAICVKELGVSREIAFPLIRKALYEEGTLNNTPLGALLKIELSVEKSASNKVLYFVVLLINEGGFESRQKFQLPMSEEWDDVAPEIRAAFTKKKGEEVVIRQLYSAETLSVTRITRDFKL